MKKNKAVLLDRDGTLIYDRPGDYLTDPKKLKIYKDAPQALKILTDLGFKLFIVSNQSAIGRGFITEQRVRQINKKLLDILKVHRIKIAGIYYCPHLPKANCQCRKPKTALGKQIIKKYKLNPKMCYMIGDKNTDLKFGYNLNMKTVFVKTGHGRDEIKLHKKLKADFMAKNILSAAKWIKKNEI